MSVTTDKNGKRHFHMTAETGHLLEEGKSLGLSALGVEEIEAPSGLLAYQLDVLREDGGTECAGIIMAPTIPRIGESVRLAQKDAEHGDQYVVLKVLDVQYQLDNPVPPNISVIACIVRRIYRPQTGQMPN